MSWVDITIIALVALFALFGVLRGVKKSAVALGAFVVAFLTAFFLSNIIAEAMLNIEGVKKFVLGSDGFSLYTWLHKALSATGENAFSPSEFLLSKFYKPVEEIVGGFSGYTATFTPVEGTALYLAFTVFSAICGVGIYLVARLLLVIVTVIIKIYIGKKKSGLGRLFGFVVGAVRGAAWAFVITLIFSAIGGFTFVGGIGKIESEYESSVIGKYFNEYSYAVKNKLFLPDEDMYSRIVKISGLTSEEDTGSDSELVGLKLELYCDLLNLNYDGANGAAFAYTDGVFTDNSQNCTLLAVDVYDDSGFGAAVSAIMDYNRRAADGIKNDGTLDSASPATLSSYKSVIQQGSGSIFNQWNAILSDLHNYEHEIDENKSLTNSELIASANASIKSAYDALVVKLDALKSTYASLSDFGTLTLTYPQPYVITRQA